MKVEILGFLVILAAAGYLIALGVGALVRPERTRMFLEGFAQTKRVHALELVIRIVVGGAFVMSAPRMPFGAAFAAFGWVLIGTTLILAFIPWRVHRRFANWSVPMATRHMSLLGLASFVVGLALLSALLLSRAAG